MGVEQRTGAGSNPCISRVVSKSDRDHGMATMAHRTLGLMPAGTICSSNLSLSLYPIHRSFTTNIAMSGLRKVCYYEVSCFSTWIVVTVLAHLFYYWDRCVRTNILRQHFQSFSALGSTRAPFGLAQTGPRTGPSWALSGLIIVNWLIIINCCSLCNLGQLVPTFAPRIHCCIWNHFKIG